ncbi:50S ribosomal protein L11 methyltransferase [Limimaricola hongkongensis]|uniref:Ribosomal protein L11 methyltransferase n=1 Tax=Limimaricola hongkongensis DSM 17492 TaxID=1122180 RepID=A0A017HED2_9RHOB|nr:50S ribosomal protein L11 methyltransferase [Limimaricola hongkongensis]EYD72660.1 Ribosomal protein L11 methyltransferase [Limimaricola hongkongensis DSM 17492]
MPVFTAITKLDDQRRGEVLSEALEELDPVPYGTGVFEIEDGSGLYEVTAYFEEMPDAVALDLLAASHGAGSFVVSEVPDEDWVAKVRRELAPVEAGRFFVYGSHDADRVPADRIGLLIEAAMAFGTGHHGTTLGCLKALDAQAAAGAAPARVADIGCGTAVLAMAAAKVWPEARVMASDIDAVAVEVAEANLAANGMAGQVECLEAAGFEHEALEAAAPFDLVFANILKGPLLALAPEMAAKVAPGGRVILSGILIEQADAVEAAYIERGFVRAARENHGEWTTLDLQRG